MDTTSEQSPAEGHIQSVLDHALALRGGRRISTAATTGDRPVPVDHRPAVDLVFLEPQTPH